MSVHHEKNVPTEAIVDALEGRVREAAESVRPPVCGICGQRAWPGDLARHLYGRHLAVLFEEADRGAA